MLRNNKSMTNPTMNGLETPELLPGTGWKNILLLPETPLSTYFHDVPRAQDETGSR
jgi:hypothetical protein